MLVNAEPNVGAVCGLSRVCAVSYRRFVRLVALMDLDTGRAWRSRQRLAMASFRAVMVPAAVIGALLLIPVSTAAFTDQTGNTANSFAADILDPPTALIATDGVSIQLDWSATVDVYATGHRLFRSSTPGGPYTQIVELTPRTNTTYVDTPPQGTYYYTARSFHGTWESANSNETTGEAVAAAATGSYVGDGTDARAITGIGFEPAVVLIKCTCAQQGIVRTSTMSGDSTKRLDVTEVLVPDLVESLDTDGFTIGTAAEVNQSGDTYHFIAFRATPTLAVGTYVGDGIDDRSITGVGFQPVMVATFADGDESVYHFASMGSSSYEFAGGAAALDKIKGVELDGFLLGVDDDVNDPGTTYHYVAWQASSTTHQSTYTGNGVDDRSITGAGFQPDFVWVKRDASSTGRLRFATNAPGASTRWDAQATETNRIQTFETDGFQIGSSTATNTTGDQYHYIAFDS